MIAELTPYSFSGIGSSWRSGDIHVPNAWQVFRCDQPPDWGEVCTRSKKVLSGGSIPLSPNKILYTGARGSEIRAK